MLGSEAYQQNPSITSLKPSGPLDDVDKLINEHLQEEEITSQSSKSPMKDSTSPPSPNARKPGGEDEDIEEEI